MRIQILIMGALLLVLAERSRADGLSGPDSGSVAAPKRDAANLTLCETPALSIEGGFYTGTLSVALSTSTPNAEIHYTLDSKEPSTSSPLYHAPLAISSTTVIRARCFAPEAEPSLIATNTYFVNEHSSFPVLSLTTDPYNLYDPDYGIFQYWEPYYESNLFQDWERPVHVEYYESNGTQGFSMDAAMKVHGGLTRAQSQKALNIYARNIYDTVDIDYKLFNDQPFTSYKSYVVRNAGNDFKWTLFRDELMHSIVNDVIDVEHSSYRPVLVFLNGSYFGIEHMHEKINEHFLASHTGADKDKVDLLEYIPYNSEVQVICGKRDAYLQLLDFIRAHDLSDSVSYAEVASQVDVNNYILYVMSEIYFDNGDWPGNNIKWWRSNDPVSKWRWILFDTDFGFGLSPFGTETGDELLHYKHNTLAIATASTGGSWPNPPYSTFLFRNLLKNESFKKQFINTFCDHLNTSFQPARVKEKIDEMKTMLAPEIPRHHARFPESAGNWYNDIQVLKTFADMRVNYVFNYIRARFVLPPTQTLTLDVSDTSQGGIRINTQIIRDYPWSGRYYPHVPVSLTAMPRPGRKFAGWSDGIKTLSRTVDLSSEQKYVAIFDEASTNNDSAVVINEINYKSAAGFDTKDWVEFYNNSDGALNLAHWILRDDNDDHGCVFPDPTVIQPFGYLVLCRSMQSFQLLKHEIPWVTGDMDFKLSSTGDALRLYNAQNILIDRVNYGYVYPWPDLTGMEGATLELTDPKSDNALPGNWKASYKTGGSPGAKNGNFMATAVSTLSGENSRIVLENYPNPFSHATTITYHLTSQTRIKLVIVDMIGKTIKTLASGTQQPGTHHYQWDGTDASGEQLPGGMYLFRLSTEQEQITQKMLMIR